MSNIRDRNTKIPYLFAICASIIARNSEKMAFIHLGIIFAFIIGSSPTSRFPPAKTTKMFNNSGILFLFLSILFFSSCRKDGGQVVSVVKDNYTIQEQQTLGLSLDEVYQSQFSILSKDEYHDAYEYVSTLYGMIVRTPNVELRDSLDWEVKIIDSNSAYQMFVSPSGTMYVTTGLLKQLVAENQLVTLMAHQVYYLESGAAFDLVKEKNDPLEVGKVVLGETSTKVEDMANTLLFAAFSADIVQEADNFEVDLLCPFKYNTTGLIDVYSNVKIHSSLSRTMPWNSQRAANIALVSQGCGVDDSLFVERYNQFKSHNLPE